MAYMRRVFVMDNFNHQDVAVTVAINHWRATRSNRGAIVSETFEFDGAANSTYAFANKKTPASAADCYLMETSGLALEVEFSIKYSGAGLGEMRFILTNDLANDALDTSALYVMQNATDTKLFRTNAGVDTQVATAAFVPVLGTKYYYRLLINLATGVYTLYRDTTFPATTQIFTGTDASIVNINYYLALDSESVKVQFDEINVHTQYESRVSTIEGMLPYGLHPGTCKFNFLRSAGDGATPAHLPIGAFVQFIMEDGTTVASRRVRFTGTIETITEGPDVLIFECLDARREFWHGQIFEKAVTSQGQQAWMREIMSNSTWLGNGPGIATSVTAVQLAARFRSVGHEMEDFLDYADFNMLFLPSTGRFSATDRMSGGNGNFPSSSLTITDRDFKVIDAGLIQDISTLFNQYDAYRTTAAPSTLGDNTSQDLYGVRAAAVVRTRSTSSGTNNRLVTTRLAKEGTKTDTFWLQVFDYFELEPGQTAVVTNSSPKVNAATCICVAVEWRVSQNDTWYKIYFSRSDKVPKFPKILALGKMGGSGGSRGAGSDSASGLARDVLI